MNTSRKSQGLDRRAFLRLLGMGSAGAGLLAACGSNPWPSAGSSGSSGPATTTTTTTTTTTAAAGAAVTGSSTTTTAGAASSAPPTGARTLVVIELDGGNDGMATLVPYGMARYHELRPELGFDPSELVVIDDEVGFHPGLSPLVEKGLAVVQGVGVPRPDLSHFQMYDRWATGDQDGTAGYRTGFLGRCADVLQGDEVATAVSLGWGESRYLAAEKALTMTLPEPDAFGFLLDEEDDYARAGLEALTILARDGDAPILSPARRGLGAGLAFAEVLKGLPEPSTGYGEDDLGLQLALASRLIRGNSGIRIVHVTMGSFDTHDDQRPEHDRLMGELGSNLARFVDDMNSAGRGDDVLVATVSEFGRRPEQNGSGTDHGAASVALLAGAVNPGRHGEHPPLDRLDEEDDLTTTVTMNQYLGTLASEWFGIPSEDVLPVSEPTLPGLVKV